MEGFSQTDPIEPKRPALKEGVDHVFNQNPELAAIGTKEQYAAYLESIFPESKIRDIVYHGTALKEKIGSFDFSKSNFAKAVFFTDNLDFAKQFAFDDVRNGSVQEQLLNAKNPFDFTNPEHIEEIREIITQLVSEGYKSPTMDFNNSSPSIFNGNELIQNPSQSDFVDHYMWRLRNGSWRIIETDRVVDFISQKYDSIKITERGSTNVAVFSKEQIHVLGSNKDLEGFKKSVDETK
ncbi:MAG: hypothetical protein V4664_03510 [Patescibacteria group bacterium]